MFKSIIGAAASLAIGMAASAHAAIITYSVNLDFTLSSGPGGTIVDFSGTGGRAVGTLTLDTGSKTVLAVELTSTNPMGGSIYPLSFGVAAGTTITQTGDPLAVTSIELSHLFGPTVNALAALCPACTPIEGPQYKALYTLVLGADAFAGGDTVTVQSFGEGVLQFAAFDNGFLLTAGYVVQAAVQSRPTLGTPAPVFLTRLDNEPADPVPLPAALPLMAVGLGALGAVRKANKRTV